MFDERKLLILAVGRVGNGFKTVTQISKILKQTRPNCACNQHKNLISLRALNRVKRVSIFHSKPVFFDRLICQQKCQHDSDTPSIFQRLALYPDTNCLHRITLDAHITSVIALVGLLCGHSPFNCGLDIRTAIVIVPAIDPYLCPAHYS